jgi:hypothetical protein
MFREVESVFRRSWNVSWLAPAFQALRDKNEAAACNNKA